MCQEKADGLACSSEYKKCLGQKVLKQINNDEAVYYANLERQAKEIDPLFDYDTTCSNIGIGDSEETGPSITMMKSQ